MANPKTLTYEQVNTAINIAGSMIGAAKRLNIDHRTFKREALRHGLYRRIHRGGRKFALADILSGKHPQYATHHLTGRLVEEGYKKYQCECCGISSWQNNSITLECDHIDGDNSNHLLSNLRLLCPDCHSQTSTFKNKNRSKEGTEVGSSHSLENCST